jgi:hypothetical protein
MFGLKINHLATLPLAKAITKTLPQSTRDFLSTTTTTTTTTITAKNIKRKQTH